MKTLKRFMYLLILSIFLFNSGCNPKIDEASPENKNIPKGLLGRWEVFSYEVGIIDKDTKIYRTIGTFGKGLAYIFYDNKTFDGCIQAGSDWDNAGATGVNGKWDCTTNKPGIWEISSLDFVDGYLKKSSSLTLITPSQKINQIWSVFQHSASGFILSNFNDEKDSDGNTIVKLLTLTKVN